MKNILKGFIIGIGKIIPGVSGSMIAIWMGVYEKALQIITNLKNMRWIDFIFIMSLALGVFISISLFSTSVNWLLKKHYLATMLLFIGLIISGIPSIVKSNIAAKDGKNVNIKYILVMFMSFLLSFILTRLGEVSFTGIEMTKKISAINLSISHLFLFYIIGFLEAFSSIIPGISGTAIFMSLGLYDLLLTIYQNILNPKYLILTLIFFSGIVTGILILAKLITYMLNNYRSFTYSVILGFLFSSILIMLLMTFEGIIFNIGIIIKSFLFILIGYIVGIKINSLLSKE